VGVMAMTKQKRKPEYKPLTKEIGAPTSRNLIVPIL
jgi:hypothetical protein